MSDASQETDSPGYGLMGLTAAAVLVALGAIFIYVPTERTEGVVQRIMYFHVPSAWIAFFAFFIVFLCSILYLWKKEREWDIYAHASAEIGIVFCSLVLITGPLWAKPIWGVWWVWDARLTAVLIMFFFYLGYIALWATIEEPEKAADLSGVLCLVGVIFAFLSRYAVTFWATLHQGASLSVAEGQRVDDAFRTPLYIMMVAFYLFFIALLLVRARTEIRLRRARSLRLQVMAA